jgi:serine/threonine protein kinase
MTARLDVLGYKIERLIAKGGMAEVYLAEQLSLGRKVALKILDAKAGDAEFAERFLNEARLVAALNHANLITIYDFGKLEGGKLYLSMEYLQGGDLEKRLKQGITESATLRIVRDLAGVLGFVHSKGILHRDIKPANILFREDDALVLTDFGIAKKIDNNVGLTQTGMIVGSPAYGSPEQIQGLELDLRTDIYSVGVLFLELLTGKNPFRADSFINTAMKHMQLDIPRLSGSAEIFQPALDKMLAKKPKERFASMEQLLAALNAIAPVTGAHRLPVSPPIIRGRTPSITTPAVSLVDNTLANVNPASHTTAKNSVNISVSRNSVTAPDVAAIAADDFLEEALKLLAQDDFALSDKSVAAAAQKPLSQNALSQKIAPQIAVQGRDADKVAAKKQQEIDAINALKNTIASGRIGKSPSGIFGGFRDRPLPSNLLDDD